MRCRTFTGLQNGLCAPPPPGAHQMLPGTALRRFSGQRCHLMRSKVPEHTFIAYVTTKPWNRWFYIRKTSTSWCSRAHLSTQKLSLCGPRLHLERLTWLTLRLLSQTGPLCRCIVLYICWYSTGNLPLSIYKFGPIDSICIARRYSTTGDVPLDAFFTLRICKRVA